MLGNIEGIGEGDNRGWDGWMASPTRWIWVWASSRSWWWTGKPGILHSMGSQRVGHDWATELNWIEKGSENHLMLPNSCLQRVIWGWSYMCAAKSLQSCPTLCDPIDSSPPGSLTLGFSRQKHWSGLPFGKAMKGEKVIIFMYLLYFFLISEDTRHLIFYS